MPATSTATSTRTNAASPAAASPPPATAVATPGSASAAWPTYGRDPQRTETGPVQPALARPARAWASAQLDGDVYGQPLVVGAHVIVATENDSLYALDATTGAVSWHVNFGAPMPGSALPCGDINPSGITGTPVYDPSTGLVYAVAFLQPGRHELYAVDAASGAVKFHRSVDPTGANPLVEQQRAALTLANGKVYLAYGGLWGDCGAYHGWVVGAPAESNGALVSYQVPSGRAAGIWAPAGPTVDPSGDLLVVTGNSFSSSQYDYNNAVIRLSPDLKVVDWFAPSDWLSLNQSDRDLGSLAATLLDGGRVFTAGKSGQGYVLDVAHLGNIGGQVFTAPVCNGAYGGALYRAPTLYVPCLDGITALTVASNGHFSVAWRGPSFAASTPILAYGALWTIDWHSAMLYALDPATGKTRFSAPLGTVMHFASPSAAEGRVFAPAGRTIIAFTPA
ncbi:MAG TPA: PQQ-binding-like beta-propeller repeat protein [Thermomicrobiaceae bacterium]|nr:PQQ-binding-like beta-propeller repeat protein [Thermomicrobiaceae bacterium]